VDQIETGVSVVNARKAFEQVVGGPSCLVESAGIDQIDDGIGGSSQFIIPVVDVPSLPDGCECLAFGGLILFQAATLVFLATAAGARFIAADFGHVAVSQ
jgi:hypothetical protein